MWRYCTADFRLLADYHALQAAGVPKSEGVGNCGWRMGRARKEERSERRGENM